MEQPDTWLDTAQLNLSRLLKKPTLIENIGSWVLEKACGAVNQALQDNRRTLTSIYQHFPQDSFTRSS